MAARRPKVGVPDVAQKTEPAMDIARDQGQGCSLTAMSQRTGRPRSPVTQKAIMVAVLSMIKREDYKDISMERIAAKARVSKHSIYRWWDSKGEVILDAFLDYALRRAAKADLTDDALDNLEQFVVRVHQAWRDPIFAKGLRGLAIEMAFDSSLRRRFNEAFFAPRKRLVASIIRQGIDRGQVRADIDIDAVVDVLFGFVWLHLSFEPFDGFDERHAAQKLMTILRPALQIRT